jgi:hypothetical protein
MYSESPKQKTGIKQAVELLIGFMVILFINQIGQAQTRTPSQPAGGEVMRSAQQKEMDRLLLLKPVPASKPEADTRGLLEQVNEDFRELERLRNSVLAEVTDRTELDYANLLKMLSQIRGMANGLKSKLALPETSVEIKELEFSDTPTFKAGLLRLDQRMVGFLTNPVFQAQVIDVPLVSEAGRDLRTIIDLSDKLKKSAKKLQKSSR